uniref:Uncharacterized protein n=1 Tax=Oryza rufipogon TaxID=4529 RepID=A0A0E0N1X1_ORYRU
MDKLEALALGSSHSPIVGCCCCGQHLLAAAASPDNVAAAQDAALLPPPSFAATAAAAQAEVACSSDRQNTHCLPAAARRHQNPLALSWPWMRGFEIYGPRTPALHLALVRPPPRVSWEAHRRNRRGARPSCPTAATGFAWRRPAAGPNDAVVQVGGCAARARRVEETALLLPRHTSRFRQPRLHDGFRRPSPHPEPVQVGCPLRRRREVTPPPGFVQGCAAARRHHRAVKAAPAPGARPPPCTPGHGGRAGRPSASPVAAARLPAGFAGAADKGEVKRRRTRT